MVTVDDRLAVAEHLGSLAVWARRKFALPMSSSAVSTLVTLELNGPTRISELAEREQLTQPGMTTLVNRMENEGYAERFADPTDGRATLVRLTAGGQDFIDARRRERTQALLAEVARLSEDDQAALVAALTAFEHLTGPDVRPPSHRKADQSSGATSS